MRNAAGFGHDRRAQHNQPLSMQKRLGVRPRMQPTDLVVKVACGFRPVATLNESAAVAGALTQACANK